MINKEIILKAVLNEYGITKDIIFKRTRKKTSVNPRQVFFYLCKMHLDTAWWKIGVFPSDFGTYQTYDHATIMHAFEAVSNNISLYIEDRERIERIEQGMIKIQESTNSILPIDIDLLEISKKNTVLIDSLSRNYV